MNHLRTSLASLQGHFTTARQTAAAVKWQDLPSDLRSQLSAVQWASLPQQTRDRVAEHIKAHPYQTAAYATAAGIVLAPPGVVAAPVVAAGNLVGFTVTGPAAGSIAAAVQPWFAPIVAGGGFATVQSAGMGGYGVATVAAAVKGGAVVGAGVNGAWSYLKGWMGAEVKVKSKL
ncbi:hypothetical protein C8Q76DRAFT_797531 [Neofusicoccum parvum]|nr:hypothetical protein C8Q76DRAFT_797531 [Neofusicoccum parvum]